MHVYVYRFIRAYVCVYLCICCLMLLFINVRQRLSTSLQAHSYILEVNDYLRICVWMARQMFLYLGGAKKVFGLLGYIYTTHFNTANQGAWRESPRFPRNHSRGFLHRKANALTSNEQADCPVAVSRLDSEICLNGVVAVGLSGAKRALLGGGGGFWGSLQSKHWDLHLTCNGGSWTLLARADKWKFLEDWFVVTSNNRFAFKAPVLFWKVKTEHQTKNGCVWESGFLFWFYC